MKYLIVIILLTATSLIGQTITDKYIQSIGGFTNRKYIVRVEITEDNHIYEECYQIPRSLWDFINVGDEVTKEALELYKQQYGK